jgi:hypothetical protein
MIQRLHHNSPTCVSVTNIDWLMLVMEMITDCCERASKHTNTLHVCLYACVYACVCVCVCKRKTARYFHCQCMVQCHNHCAFKYLMHSYKNMNILKRSSVGPDKIKCNFMVVAVLLYTH